MKKCAIRRLFNLFPSSRSLSTSIKVTTCWVDSNIKLNQLVRHLKNVFNLASTSLLVSSSYCNLDLNLILYLIQHLSSSTKLSTNSETSMLSTLAPKVGEIYQLSKLSCNICMWDRRNNIFVKFVHIYVRRVLQTYISEAGKLLSQSADGIS